MPKRMAQHPKTGSIVSTGSVILDGLEVQAHLYSSSKHSGLGTPAKSSASAASRLSDELQWIVGPYYEVPDV